MLHQLYSQFLIRLATVLLGWWLTVSAHAIPAFPGAEGWGDVTVGGRGGAVLHVTNLNDSGPGSFRAACEASGPRTVVFDISGIIQLTNEVQITNSYITIAGQTAPGDGVIVAGATVNMTGGVSDVLVRYMRFRRSYDKAKWAVWVANGAPNGGPLDPRGQCLVGMSTTRNIMVDHVSVSWGTDENMSIYRRYIPENAVTNGSTLVPTKNITVQWCISSEALNPTNHGFGDTLGGQGANHHHNLLACNVGRNPSISFSHFMDWRNNVIFNWRNRSMDGGGAEAHLNVINNYYKPGLATGFGNQWEPDPQLVVRITKPEIRTWGTEFGLTKRAYSGPGVIGWWYVNGNVVEGYPEVTSNNWEGLSLVSGNYYRGVQWDSAVWPYPGVGPAIGESHPEWTGHHMTNHMEWARVLTPNTHAEYPEDPDDPEDGTNGVLFVIPDLPKVATQSALDAYQTVLAGAGATLPVRDPVDVRTVNMVISGIATNGSRTNGIINHPDEVGGYPTIAVVTRPANWDTDQDGMPDAWETQHGLNPNDAADRNGDFDNDGYTNLEEFLNELGAFKAVQDVVWDGSTNNRYAQIENWDIAFQPSRFDTVIISNATVVVDAIGQHAGILRLTNGATLNITNGWLKIADKLEIGAGCTNNVNLTGQLVVTNDLVNRGTLRLTGDASFTVGGTFTNTGLLDVMTWSGTLPPGLVNLGTVLGRSAIRVLSVQVNGTNFEAIIQGYTGHCYQLQYRDDLSSGAWANIGAPIIGTNAPITMTHDGGAAAQQGYYRVVVD
jgi:pectate lyase